jgi:hypothetical protein
MNWTYVEHANDVVVHTSATSDKQSDRRLRIQQTGKVWLCSRRIAYSENLRVWHSNQ